MKGLSFAFALLLSSVDAWLPTEHDLAAFKQNNSSLQNSSSCQNSSSLHRRALPDWKIRGVNLGGWLISEPWMMAGEWSRMGCGGKCSEFDFVNALGQSRANSAFNDHYSRWITPDDIQRIHDARLNTIRIPIGYWSLRSIVDDSEHFPEMDLKHLDNVVQKAADLGMYVVMDLHGAPGSQVVAQTFTGQCLDEKYLAAFFTQYNYDRASKWLDWMTRRIHQTPSYQKAVGMIEVVNEPQTDRDKGGIQKEQRSTFTQNFYPQALAAVRKAEDALSIAGDQRLDVQYMDKQWGSGNPKSNLSSDDRVAFDNHPYAKYQINSEKGSNAKQGDYMYFTCFRDNRNTDNNTPKIVGEWSISVFLENENEFKWTNGNNVPFYKQWFIAQQRLYEQTNGWIYWSWKTELNDPRWDYSYLVNRKWVPTSAGGLDASRRKDVCKDYFGQSDGRN